MEGRRCPNDRGQWFTCAQPVLDFTHAHAHMPARPHARTPARTHARTHTRKWRLLCHKRSEAPWAISISLEDKNRRDRADKLGQTILFTAERFSPVFCPPTDNRCVTHRLLDSMESRCMHARHAHFRPHAHRTAYTHARTHFRFSALPRARTSAHKHFRTSARTALPAFTHALLHFRTLHALPHALPHACTHAR